jgi:hypothetical protein
MANPSEPTVDVGALTEVVISAAKRALEDRSAEAPGPEFWHPPIVVGVIIDPGFGGVKSASATAVKDTQQ